MGEAKKSRADAAPAAGTGEGSHLEGQAGAHQQRPGKAGKSGLTSHLLNVLSSREKMKFSNSLNVGLRLVC